MSCDKCSDDPLHQMHICQDGQPATRCGVCGDIYVTERGHSWCLGYKREIMADYTIHVQPEQVFVIGSFPVENMDALVDIARRTLNSETEGLIFDLKKAQQRGASLYICKRRN